MARSRAKERPPAKHANNLSNVIPPRAAPADVSAWRDRALVAAVAVGASLAGIANDFVFDDVPQVVENIRIHDLSHIGEILTSAYWPPPYAPELFRPVASISVALQYLIGGGGPTIFRVVSYLLYALAAVGVYSLAARLLPRRIALGIGVLFAAHPVHVEAVALAVNQGELIVGWAATAATIRYLDRRREGGLTAGDWGMLCVLFALAALSKENGFVVPALLVAVECFVVGENTGLPERVRAVWRGYAALTVVGVALLVARAAVLSGNVAGALPAKAIAGLSLGGRLLTMLQLVPKWLRLLAWPAHLQIDYSPNEIVASTHLGAQELLGLALLIAFAVIAWLARRRAPVITFGLTWCAIALFPVSNIVPTGIVVAERTLFLPSIGFLIAVGGAVDLLLKRYAAIERPLAAACGILAITGVARSDLRHRTWRNGQTMWQAAEVDAPRSLRVKQAHDEAVADLARDFERAIAASPAPWRVEFELATLLRYMRADSAALDHLRKSVAAQPNQTDATLELSATLISTGHYVEAKEIASRVSASDNAARAAQVLTALADSASRTNAPAGSVRVIARELLPSNSRP